MLSGAIVKKQGGVVVGRWWRHREQPNVSDDILVPVGRPSAQKARRKSHLSSRCQLLTGPVQLFLFLCFDTSEPSLISLRIGLLRFEYSSNEIQPYATEKHTYRESRMV